MFPEKIGRYDVLAELGRGGMATVYKARDPRFKREVAIKVLPVSFVDEEILRARFEREAQTIANLEFPGIVPVYDFGEENGQPYLVMRYMQGGSLYLKLRDGPLSIVESSRIITRLAAALDYVHAKGIIHRDLKPANILFDQFTNAYLSDFGIARLQEVSVVLTGDGMIGTPAYMSPEQARGESDIDGRSDIYALGAIIFEMITGRQPYEATTPMGVAMKHVLEPAPSILSFRSDLPTPCDTLILRAMAKQREERYQTAKELAQDLANIATSLAETPPPTIINEDTVVQPEPARHPALPISSPSASVISTPPAPAESLVQSVPEPLLKSASPIPIAKPSTQTPPPAIAHSVSRKPLSKSLATAIISGMIGLLCLLIFVVFSLRGVRMVRNFLNYRSSILKSTPTQFIGTESVITPTVASTPLPTLGAILFQDDFSNPASGWERYQGADGVRDYESGAYRILVDVPHQWFISTSGQNFTNVSIQVNATKVAGPDDNFFGIICRFQDIDNFYFLIISSDGFYAIGKIIAGDVSLIGQDAMHYSEFIHRGVSDNSLQAICAGNQLILYTNGTKLVSVEDTTLTGGDVGLVVGTYNTHGANMVFDNFIVAKP